jgi:hypothetical protein
MSEKEADRFEELANNINFEFDYYANSECLSYSNGEDFLSRIEFKSITNEEYDKLNKLFGNQFGIFIGEDYLKNVLTGDDEETNEDDDNDDDDYNENW